MLRYNPSALPMQVDSVKLELFNLQGYLFSSLAKQITLTTETEVETRVIWGGGGGTMPANVKACTKCKVRG
jgi:hypothetical protein